MANKITHDDIININKLYLKYGTYAAVARELGFSAGTVKKYIIDGFKPDVKIRLFDENSLELFDENEFEDVDDFGSLCELSDDEKGEMVELWDEMVM